MHCDVLHDSDKDLTIYFIFQDQDTSDEDDVLDHDDPPYQAPPIIEAVVEADDESSDTNSEDDNDDLEAGRIDSSASESTRLSSTGMYSYNEIKWHDRLFFAVQQAASLS